MSNHLLFVRFSSHIAFGICDLTSALLIMPTLDMPVEFWRRLDGLVDVFEAFDEVLHVVNVPR